MTLKALRIIVFLCCMLSPSLLVTGCVDDNGNDPPTSSTPADSPSAGTPTVTPEGSVETPSPTEVPPTETPAAPTPTPSVVDVDGDGYYTPEDCDDFNTITHPGATELCDTRDNDCDGDVDEGVGQPWYPDRDQDGYGSDKESTTACTQPEGYLSTQGDCDDFNSTTYPGATERCDAADNDCDGTIDEDVTTRYFLDGDLDGFGIASSTTQACSLPPGYSARSGDCNDADAAVYPGAAEVCDLKDNDCDETVDEGVAPTWYLDADQDTWGTSKTSTTACTQPTGYVSRSGDCNDSAPAVNPAATEVCDTIDNNCDNLTDQGIGTTFYVDEDADSYGVTSLSLLACSKPQGYATVGGDCNDANPLSYPTAPEICDDQDNDCDSSIDEGVPTVTLYLDNDGDDFGQTSKTFKKCNAPTGYSLNSGDCNDADATVYPGATESSDLKDNNCNGMIDENDFDQDGYAPWQGDCDDTHPGVNPDAQETCDGLDNNCNGQVDEFLAQRYHPDADGDGFGANTGVKVACTPPTGYLAVRGDCNDADANVHPGAEDPTGDGKDQDCGGTTGPEVHVGYTDSSVTTLQTALDAAVAGTSIWVGPGTYSEYNLSYKGKAVTLISSHYSAKTTVDARQLGRVFLFQTGETSSSVLDGFRIIAGTTPQNNYGGGIYVSSASPTFRYNHLDLNNAHYGGGGMYLKSSKSLISDCTFTNNSSTATSGGGLYLESSAATVTRGRFQANKAHYGGSAIMFYLSDALVTDTTIHGHTSYGAIYTSESNPTFTGCTISGNGIVGASTDYDIMIRSNSTGIGATFKRCLISGNQGGVRLAANVTFINSILVGNQKPPNIYGSPIFLNTATSTFINSTVTGNGGGIFGSSVSSKLIMSNSIVAHNQGYNLEIEKGAPPTLVISYSNFFNRFGPNTNLDNLPSTVVVEDPGFMGYSNDGDGTNDDLHLGPDSTLVNAGDPSILDPDGSRSDMGAYGGPGADVSYAADADGDGLLDGWETLHGLNPTLDDAQDDPDEDGASNEDELAQFSNPLTADGDGDGWLDGQEFVAGSLSDEWYSQPAKDNPQQADAVVAKVPGHFATLQAALDRIHWEGTIELQPGTFSGFSTLTDRAATVIGRDGAAATLLNNSITTEFVLTINRGWLGLRGVTVNGTYGGVSMTHSSGELDHVTFTETANYNALELNVSSPTLSNCIFSSNRGGYGAAIGMTSSSPTIQNCLFEANSIAGGYGGALKLDDSNPVIEGCVFTGNSAAYGGALHLASSSPTLRNCTITGNTATKTNGGGGIFLEATDSRPTLINTVVAYNSNYNLFNSTTSPGIPSVLYSNLYAAPTLPNHNLTSLDATNLTLEPKFSAYDSSGNPSNFHMALSSPLKNTGDPGIFDPDGSRSDMGGYGGEQSELRDLDDDGYPDWFWPGALGDAPNGFDAADFDANDRDAGVH